ncbi:ADP-ribosylation factor GTPase-activating protein AGD3-like isoform X2 [Arachis stenosperma]|uniref:ADP-ribosylation factor GTPase-activating protein AGD3-like isoform X2 n=1 Tax=Arachis stenosperma TaxID=217475 RepID=UPI0025AB9A05|nr:ADP-ribosylation factor GTPase-activating protein AGD3-like isoform X2 [Arachis stenosperma]
MHFAKLDDSPMFRQQCLEESAESLRIRCCKFHKGCRKYTEGLGEVYEGDVAFATALEDFGSGHNDPHFAALGEPVMSKFTTALREISTYKELLRSQVEQMLTDRLQHIMNVDIHEVKEARKRFDKASAVYDQAREKFMSLKKSTKPDIATTMEEELQNARTSFEEARFNLVVALNNIEAKKRFEFLEAITGIMDAHLRYFQQGYQLLHQMQPFFSEILDYVQQSRESYDEEQISLYKRMEEYKKRVYQESRMSLNGPYGSPNGDSVHPFSRISNEVADVVKESAANGKVEIIRQGFLSKRSSNLRGDWKRRYFVLDSRGMLYYYRKPWNGGTENGSGLLSRWLSSHYHGGVHDERYAARHTVNLLTSTIKADSDQSDLRFCFRIISPSKNYTLQAENAVDQMDWMEKITGVIASLLSVQSLGTPPCAKRKTGDSDTAKKTDVPESSLDDGHTVTDKSESRKCTTPGSQYRTYKSLQLQRHNMKSEKPIEVLRRVSGNDKCADCGKPEPDWASLNLGILICIECSGIHRNLGVHISKVRSLTLDVKVWDPYVLTMFKTLGNYFANSVWEELASKSTLQTDDNASVGSSNARGDKVKKPKPDDSISLKEKFIHAKYSEKMFICRTKESHYVHSVAKKVWESICANDMKAAYRHIVKSGVDVNAINGHTLSEGSCNMTSSDKSNISSPSQRENQLMNENIQLGSGVLHLACITADAGMVELLLQYGADINACDSKGQTPLHYSITAGNTEAAKVLLMRGANSNAADKEGNTPIKLASQSNSIDAETLALLARR